MMLVILRRRLADDHLLNAEKNLLIRLSCARAAGDQNFLIAPP
jgi:hypothetical protein